MSLPDGLPTLESSTATLGPWSLEVPAAFAGSLPLLAAPRFELSASVVADDGYRRTRDGTLTASLAAADCAALIDAIEGAPGPPPARLYHAGVEVFAGLVTQLRREGAIVTITISAGLPGTDRLICRRLFDAWLPIVFGTAGVECVPLFTVARARLRGELNGSSTAVALDRPVDWPTSGSIQIDDEVLEYAALSDDRRTLLTLSRADVRSHRAGSDVVLLPATPLRWCAADHAATVLGVRSGGTTGPLLTAEGESVTIEGATATVIELDALPLSIDYTRSELVALSALGADPWDIDESTTALNPSDAVNYAAPRRGSVLSEARPLWTALYTEDLALTQERFDQVLSAALLLEYSDTPFWGEDTLLRLTIAKGADSIVVDLVREGVDVTSPGEAEASITLGAAYMTVRIPIDSLLPAEERWRFFTDFGGDLSVTIELIDPPSLTGWSLAIRGIRWERRLLPATRVRTNTSLWALVEGLDASPPDGLCEPVAVVERLLSVPRFANQPSEEIDDASFALPAAPTQYGRVIAGELTVRAALEQALGELPLTLTRSGGLWRLVPRAVDSASALAPVLPPRDRISALRPVTGSHIRMSMTPPLPLWTKVGLDRLSLLRSAALPAYRQIFEFEADLRCLPFPPGLLLRIPSSTAGEWLQGPLEHVCFDGRGCRFQITPCERLRIAHGDETASVIALPGRRDLRLLAGNRCAAILDQDGNLRLRGSATPEATGLTLGGFLVTFRTSPSRIVIGLGEAGIMEIDLDGLRVGGLIATDQDFAGALMEEGDGAIESPAGVVSIGLAGGPVLARLVDGELLLRGSLVENDPLLQLF